MFVFFYTFTTFFNYLFKIDIASVWVWQDLLFKHSFRYSESNKKEFRIYLVFFKVAVKKLFNSNKLEKKANAAVVVLDINPKSENERLEYVEQITRNKNISFIAKSNLPNSFSLIEGIAYFICLLIVSFFCAILLFLFKNKANIALIQVEFIELLQLSSYIRKNKISKIIFFSAYEKDTCYVSNYLVNKLDVFLQLVPSANPISFHYKKVICTTFTFTIPYQKIEHENLKNNWQFKNTVSWQPAGFMEILKTINKTTNKNTIGYVSSAFWLRKHLGHAEVEKGSFEAEENLIQQLNHFVQNNKDVKLYISIHPLERKTEVNLEKSIAFYTKHFGSTYEFLPFGIKTRNIPEKFDVGISISSSAMFERLFAGYKIMFSQKGLKQNYFFDERISKLIVSDYNSFELLLSELLQISSEEYFNRFNIADYRYDAYKYV